MLKKLFAVAAALFLLGNVSSILAAETNDGQSQMTAEEFVASLKFQSGKIELPNGTATLDLPPS